MKTRTLTDSAPNSRTHPNLERSSERERTTDAVTPASLRPPEKESVLREIFIEAIEDELKSLEKVVDGNHKLHPID